MMRKYLYGAPVFLSTLVGGLLFSQQAAAQIIYGIGNSQHFNHPAKGTFYIQAASFLKKSRASQYQNFLHSKTSYPIKTIHSGSYHRVLIGPIHSSAEVRHVADSLSFPLKTKTVVTNTRPKKNQTKQKNPSSTESNQVISQVIPAITMDNTRANWFVSVGGGAQYPHFNSSMVVTNDSDFLPPYNQDVYSTNNNNEAIFGVMAGRRWERDTKWLPSYSLGVLYQHFFSARVDGTVMQYSLPEFTNYNYKWNLSSNLVLASAKLNLFQYAHRISPFINGGIGASFNKASGYNEVFLPGVTPRVSPGFADSSTRQFTYALGAGVDYQVMQQLILSVGYNYQDLGHFSSGQGTQNWAGQSLNLGSYQTNDVFASVSYLFEK